MDFDYEAPGKVADFLGKLKLEGIEAADPKVCGGPMRFKVTEETVKHLPSLVGRVVSVGGDAIPVFEE